LGRYSSQAQRDKKHALRNCLTEIRFKRPAKEPIRRSTEGIGCRSFVMTMFPVQAKVPLLLHVLVLTEPRQGRAVPEALSGA